MTTRLAPFVLTTSISFFSIVTATAATIEATIDMPIDKTITAIKPIKVIDPGIERRVVHQARIDTESFELGAYAGTLAVEEFGAQRVAGITSAYHLSSRALFQINYGRSDVGRATFEDILNRSFLRDDDRVFSHYNILAGYNLFPGKTFYGIRAQFHSGIYLLAGGGKTEFAGSSSFTPVIGSSYRVVVTDWLTWSIDLKDYIFERDFLNIKKQTHNVELSSSLNFLF